MIAIVFLAQKGREKRAEKKKKKKAEKRKGEEGEEKGSAIREEHKTQCSHALALSLPVADCSLFI